MIEVLCKYTKNPCFQTKSLKNCCFGAKIPHRLPIYTDERQGFNSHFCTNELIMIQRIQSVFLFLVDIVLVVLLFVPNAYTRFTAMETTEVAGITLLDQPVMLVAQIVLCILAAATMAMFRNRSLQMKLCMVGVVLSAIFSGLLAYPMMVTLPGIEVTAGPGLYISLANILLFLLARMFIKKDDELVKSTDRIR